MNDGFDLYLSGARERAPTNERITMGPMGDPNQQMHLAEVPVLGARLAFLSVRNEQYKLQEQFAAASADYAQALTNRFEQLNEVREFALAVCQAEAYESTLVN